MFFLLPGLQLLPCTPPRTPQGVGSPNTSHTWPQHGPRQLSPFLLPPPHPKAAPEALGSPCVTGHSDPSPTGSPKAVVAWDTRWGGRAGSHPLLAPAHLHSPGPTALPGLLRRSTVHHCLSRRVPAPTGVGTSRPRVASADRSRLRKDLTTLSQLL